MDKLKRKQMKNFVQGIGTRLLEWWKQLKIWMSCHI